MAGKIEVYQDAAGLWRFRLRAGSGQIVAVGEAFATRELALAGVRRARRAMEGAEVVEP